MCRCQTSCYNRIKRNTWTLDAIGLDAWNLVFWGLRTANVQTSLRIRAAWSLSFFFAYWKVSKSATSEISISICSLLINRLVRIWPETPKTCFLKLRLHTLGLLLTFTVKQCYVKHGLLPIKFNISHIHVCVGEVCWSGPNLAHFSSVLDELVTCLHVSEF